MWSVRPRRDWATALPNLDPSTTAISVEKDWYSTGYGALIGGYDSAWILVGLRIRSVAHRPEAKRGQKGGRLQRPSQNKYCRLRYSGYCEDTSLEYTIGGTVYNSVGSSMYCL